MTQLLRAASLSNPAEDALTGAPRATFRRARRSMSAVLVAAALVLGVTVSAASPASAGPAPVLTLSILAGTGTSGSPTAGPATSSALRSPRGVAVDGQGNTYVADQVASRVLKVTPGGTLSFFAGTGASGLPTAGAATSSALLYPNGVAVDSADNVYISNGGRVVVKVTPGGTLSYFAGTGTYGTPTAGPATSSPLIGPESVAVDGADNVYIADGPRVLKVTSGGTLSILAGTGSEGRPVTGSATSSPLAPYNSLGVDEVGNVYVTGTWEYDDGDNLYTYSYAVKVTPGGLLSYVAGTGRSSYSVQTAGPAINAALYRPKGVAVDSAGNVYIADVGVVLKVTSEGALSIFAGKGSPNYGAPTLGPVADSKLISPYGIAVDSAGAMYIVDAYVLLKVSYPVLETAPEAPSSLGATPGNGSASIAFTAGADGGAAITNYKYQLDGGSWVALSPADATSPVTIPGLTNGTTYDVKLKAVNTAGDGAESASVSVTPRTVPSAPTAVVATPGDGSVSIAFVAGANGGSSITRYQYRIASGAWIDAVGTTSPITVSGLTNYTTYSIRMRAVNIAGAGAVSAAVSARPKVTGPAIALAHSSGNHGVLVGFSIGRLTGSKLVGFTVRAYAKGTRTVVSSCEVLANGRGCFIGSLESATQYDIRAQGYFRPSGSETARSTLESAAVRVRVNG